MKYIIAFIAMFLHTYAAACNLNISPGTTSIDTARACKAASVVQALFQTMGYTVMLNTKVDHVAEVYVPYTSHAGIIYKKSRGVFYATENRIEIERAPVTVLSGDLFSDFYFTIIVHELIHAAVAELLPEDYRSINTGQHELLAYCGQYHTMSSSVRNKNLTQVSSTFSNEYQINNLVYFASDPAVYTAMSVAYCEKHGINQVFRKILSLQSLQINIDGL